MAFGMTFIMGVQSAIYSPAKYGYIKELVGSQNLAGANGVVQATTTVAILSGIFGFSILFEKMFPAELSQNPELIGQSLTNFTIIGFLLIVIALFELIMTYKIPSKNNQKIDLPKFEVKRYLSSFYLRRNLKSIYKDSHIWLSIIGLSIFWSVSQLVIATFPAHAKEVLEITNTVKIQGILALSGIGIVIGSIIAGKMSRGFIELGLIPAGAIGLSVSLALLPSADNIYYCGAIMIGIGFFGGIFLVPLNSLIQFRTKVGEEGTVLAGNNFIQTISMIAFLSLGLLITNFLSKSPTEVLFLLPFIALIGAAYTIYKLPQSMLKVVFGLFFKRWYKIKVQGFENIPETGGVLLLGNHISWVDWAVLQIAFPRNIRFVMDRKIYENRYLNWLLKSLKLIPISNGSYKKSLEVVSEALTAGEVVCIFPEGTISRTGQLNEFKHGFEKAAENAYGIILPFYLHGLWGSFASRSGDRLKKIKGSEAKTTVIVSFGEPMEMNSKAMAVKNKVFDLSFKSWDEDLNSMEILSKSFVTTAKSKMSEISIVDSLTKKELSFRRVLTGSILFRHEIIKEESDIIGILLPSTAACSLVNIGALMAGKTVLNINFSSPSSAIIASLDLAEVGVIYTSEKFVSKLKSKGVDIESVFEGRKVIVLEEMAKTFGKIKPLITMLIVSILHPRLIKNFYCEDKEMNDVAAILFSSGSESMPKGVMLSHKNVLGNLKQISDVLDCSEDDCILASLPPFHAFGLTVTTFMPLIEGLKMVCIADPTDAVGVGKAVAKYNVTIMCATSTFLRLYTKNRRVNPLMFKSLKLIVAGAEKLSSDVRQGFKEKFGHDIYEGYGATETTPVATVNLPNKLDLNNWQVHTGNKVGSVGLPLPGSTIRIVDPASFEELSYGEEGMIIIGGTQVMVGYLKNEEKNNEVLFEKDGIKWYVTGDKGKIDEDGFLTIVDRYSRFAKIGGEMIGLTSLEEKIQKLIPSDVDFDSIAVNIPCEKKGEKIVLVYSGKISDGELKNLILDSDIPSLSTPNKLMQLDSVPILGSGKKDFKTAKTIVLEGK
jgi:acyl-[acyl-carrier-protein]-phospholipid O-acyltransferase/long-chain-fatty-acid--[acyl-carrier-protein] ligase